LLNPVSILHRKKRLFMYLPIRKLWGKNRRKIKSMTIASIPISPFEGFGIKNEAKEASREAIHETIGSWIDDVVEMSVPGKIHNSQ